MPNSFSKIYLHAVFAVKGRQNLLSKPVRNKIFPYITGILKNCDVNPIAINGVEDHVHVLFRLRPRIRVCDVMREIKAGSSKYINKERLVRGKFAWQTGYGVFSCGRRAVPNVTRYIQDQEAHHARQSFKKEYVGILDRHQIDYAERYLFDFISPEDIQRHRMG